MIFVTKISLVSTLLTVALLLVNDSVR